MKRIFLFASLLAAVSLPSFGAAGSGFNHKGNILIADQFNNRVIEVDPATHMVVWQFGTGSSVAGPKTVVAVNDAERVGSLTLMSGTGTPAGATPDCPNGCPDNRVLLVNAQGQIVWQYGMAGIAGSGPNQLNAPVCSVFLPKGVILITDQGNQRVIGVTMFDKKIAWQYGTTGVSGSGPNQLNNPNSAELLENGNVLIADESNNRVIEVNPNNNQIVWSYSAGINLSAFASRLENGDTLISDQGNNRIIEVNQAGSIVWQYSGSGTGLNAPTRAVRLSNGNTLISDQNNNVVIEIDAAQQIVFTQGMLGTTGSGFNMLYAPYDAKVIGDYTGLTPPNGEFE